MLTAAAIGLVPLNANAQSLKDQITGTWMLVEAIDVHPDGRRENRWGPDGKGIFIYDGKGNFTQFITRADLPKIAGGTLDKATAEEAKAIVSGLVASFGTYTVNEAEKTITTRVVGGVFPNLIGRDQKRTIISLSADELKYKNPATSTGTSAESTWKRAK
jgi:hypothetical protein